MKRCVLQMVWGGKEKYLAEAISCATTVRRNTPFPVILVADPATSALVPAGAPFDEVRTADIASEWLLPKCHVWHHVPKEFDSFVFLDNDIAVLDDLVWPFEKAETHGLAMAPAPHYALDEFWGFGETLKAFGLPCRGQMTYNTGVIFATRRPDVEAVFLKWSELGTLAAERGWRATDQPFFTLALELLGFNPYTLSPAYNHRGIGTAVGRVRIWHSHAPVPPDLNDYDKPWPPRPVKRQ